MPHKTEEDLSETKSISAKNKKIQIALGICLASCIGAEEIDFLHMIFFASGRTNAVIASNVSGFLPILSLLSLKTMFLFSYYIAYARKKGKKRKQQTCFRLGKQ